MSQPSIFERQTKLSYHLSVLAKLPEGTQLCGQLHPSVGRHRLRCGPTARVHYRQVSSENNGVTKIPASSQNRGRKRGIGGIGRGRGRHEKDWRDWEGGRGDEEGRGGKGD
eukprot:190758-Amorphochlora_amoeboformis.AAC.1